MQLVQQQLRTAALPTTGAANTNLLQDISRLITLHRSGHSSSSVAKGFRNYLSTVSISLLCVSASSSNISMHLLLCAVPQHSMTHAHANQQITTNLISLAHPSIHRLWSSVMLMKRLQRMPAAASAGVLMRCYLHLARC
jgi:hypothetical protein